MSDRLRSQKNIFSEVIHCLHNAKKIDKNIKTNFIIEGKQKTGKTYLAEQIYSELKDEYNCIMLNNFFSNNNTNSFSRFFGLSIEEPYKHFSIKINNKRIESEHRNYFNYFIHDLLKTNESKHNFSISPYMETEKFKRFIEPMETNVLCDDVTKKCLHTYENDKIDLSGNLLIIDNAESIKREDLIFIDFNLKRIFKSKDFFANAKIVFLGNPEKKSTYNFFDLKDYENNILNNNFTFLTLNITIPLIDIILQTPQIENWRMLDFDYNTDSRIGFENATIISKDYKFIISRNLEKLDKLTNENKEIKFVVYVDNQINLKEKFNNLNSSIQEYYIKSFNEPVFICKDMRILFVRDISDASIKKGSFGVIQEIKYCTKKISDKEPCIIKKINDVDLKMINVNDVKIKVLVKKKIKTITASTMISKVDNEIIFTKKYLPFINTACINLKYLNFISDNVPLILDISNDFKRIELEDFIHKTVKIENTRFLNTVFLNSIL